MDCREKLSEATTAAVISLRFDSTEAVSLISPEGLGKWKIPVGQIKMLMKAVKQTLHYIRGMTAQPELNIFNPCIVFQNA
jgi:hypothetical protein